MSEQCGIYGYYYEFRQSEALSLIIRLSCAVCLSLVSEKMMLIRWFH